MSLIISVLLGQCLTIVSDFFFLLCMISLALVMLITPLFSLRART